MSIRLSFVAALMILFAGCEQEPAPSPDEPIRQDRPATPQEWPTGFELVPQQEEPASTWGTDPDFLQQQPETHKSKRFLPRAASAPLPGPWAGGGNGHRFEESSILHLAHAPGTRKSPSPVKKTRPSSSARRET